MMEELFEHKFTFWENVTWYLWGYPKDKIKRAYYSVKWFFKNLWRFRKILWNYRTWDFSYCNNLFADSLLWLADDIKNGMEEERSANKKVAALKEFSSLIKGLTDDTDFGLRDLFIERKISIDEYNKRYIHSRKEYLDRIYRIIYGQKPSENKFNKSTEYDKWADKFDGTGYENWWE